MNEYLDQMLGTMSELDQTYVSMQQQIYLQKTSKQQNSALSSLKQGQTLVQSLTAGKNIGKPKPDIINDHYFGFPEDSLPQPFKAIYQIIQESILKKVYLAIFDREKNKQDINFEGDITQRIPSGVFEIDGITCLAHDHYNPYNSILAGDKNGHLYLLDMSQKIQLNKKEVFPEKRVLHISCITKRMLDCYVTTVAVILNSHPNIYIYRYTSKDNQLYQNFIINAEQQQQQKEEEAEQKQEASFFPFEATFAQNAKILAVTHYSGHTTLFAIPDPVIQQKVELQTDEAFVLGIKQSPSNVSFSSQNSNNSSPSKQPTEPKNQIVQLDVAASAITDNILQIQTVFPRIPTTYEKEFQNFVNKQTHAKQEQLQQMQEAAAATAKAPFKKGEPKKALLGKQVEEPAEKQTTATVDVARCSNKEQWFIHGNETLESPRYRARVFFLPMTETIANADKQFNKPECQLKVGDFVQVFMQTKKWGVVSCKEDKDGKYSFVSKNEYELIYDICAVEASKNGVFMAFGLAQGSIIVWDVLMMQERFYLDKHALAVSTLRFLGDIILVSGGYDGTVHAYDLQNEGKPIMKRTNLFRQKKYHIANVAVSDAGVACVLDSKNNLRMYDLYHGQKILRLIPSPKDDLAQKKWKHAPYSILLGGKEQFVIVAEISKKQIPITQESSNPYQSLESSVKPQQQQEEDKEVNEGLQEGPWDNQTQLLIFRTFDNLINLFPGLSSLYRKGISEQKVLTAFRKLDMKYLLNPAFEIKNLLPEQASEIQSSKKAGKKQTKRQPTLQQSSIGSQSRTEFSSSIDFNSSFQSSIQQKKPIVIQSKGQPNIGLTKDALHPEQQLADKQDYNIPKIIDENKLTIDNVRNRNAQRNQRQDRMVNIQNKIQQELQLNEEKQRLEKQKLLLNSIAPTFQNSKKKK